MLNFLDDKTGAKNSTPAANGAFCAAADGKFQEFHNAVFASQVTEGEDVTDAELGAWAAAAGITGDALTTWQKCVADGTYTKYVTSVNEAAFTIPSFQGTPTADDQRRDRRPDQDRHARAADPGDPERHQVTAYLPSPTVGVFHLGPFPVRMYALCILLGIVLAVWLTGRRMVPRGGEPGQVLDVAAWGVLFGIVGGRLYHVITTPGPYWGEGGHPVDALKIWQGGLGIWGAIALGALGVYIGCRRSGISFLTFVDAAVPGVAFAQAIGRFGNWFNNELYGGPTTVPWGLQIHEWDQSAGRAVLDSAGNPVVKGIFQPTFLYEAIFLVLLGTALLVVDKRRTLAPGPADGPLRGRVPGRPDRHREDAHRRGRAHPRASG